MNPKLKEEIELQYDCGDFVNPDNISKEDREIINEMVEVLSHERFNHGGWKDYDFYKVNACYFLLKLIKLKESRI